MDQIKFPYFVFCAMSELIKYSMALDFSKISPEVSFQFLSVDSFLVQKTLWLFAVNFVLLLFSHFLSVGIVVLLHLTCGQDENVNFRILFRNILNSKFDLSLTDLVGQTTELIWRSKELRALRSHG